MDRTMSPGRLAEIERLARDGLAEHASIGAVAPGRRILELVEEVRRLKSLIGPKPTDPLPPDR